MKKILRSINPYIENHDQKIKNIISKMFQLADNNKYSELFKLIENNIALICTKKWIELIKENLPSSKNNIGINLRNQKVEPQEKINIIFDTIIKIKIQKEKLPTNAEKDLYNTLAYKENDKIKFISKIIKIQWEKINKLTKELEKQNSFINELKKLFNINADNLYELILYLRNIKIKRKKLIKKQKIKLIHQEKIIKSLKNKLNSNP